MSDVLYWLADRTACGQYRCLMPGRALTAKGHRVLADETLSLEAYDHADVLVGQRVAKPGPSKLWQALARDESRTARLVYELDDDVFALCEEPSNPNSVTWPVLVGNVVRNLACADVVTVSTAPLAEVVSKFTSAPVHVVPNAVEQSLIDLGHTDRVRVEPFWRTVGWSGSATHNGDWSHQRTAYHVMQWLKRNARSRWLLHTIGDPPEPLHEVHADAAWRITRGTTDIAEYYRAVHDLFDVALAPLAPTRFNASKSDLRLLELSALGIPWVASNWGPYAIDTEACGGLFVSKTRDWWTNLDWMRRTIERDLLDDLRFEGRKWAATRTIDKVLPRWEEALGL